MFPANSELLTVRLFPLPGIVLFPGSVLPLRIFEPRYRELLQDALDSDKLIAMAQLRETSFIDEPPGNPPIHEVLGLGEIAAHETNTDGTSHIALLGRGRYRIQEELPHKPYRLARVIQLEDRLPADGMQLHRLKKAQKEMIATAKALIGRTMEPDAAKQLLAALKERKQAGAASDLLASIYVQDPALRQVLLESVDVLARTRMVHAALEKLLVKVEPKSLAMMYDHKNISLN